MTRNADIAPRFRYCASGLRAYAAAIRPSAADYFAHALVGTMDKVEAARREADDYERAAKMRGWKARQAYLRAKGYEEGV